MAYDTFVGLPLDQSIASATWDNGGMAWGSVTHLAGDGANGLKSTQVSPNQSFGNYNALDNHIGQRVFFKLKTGRSTSSHNVFLYIDGAGPHAVSAPNSVRVGIGAYNEMVLRDMAGALETKVAFAPALDTEYCLELKRTGTANQYRATVFNSTNGVAGSEIATQVITLATALASANRQVQIAGSFSSHPYVTITRVESVDATAAPADTVAPILSAPTATATGSTTASGTVATDEAGGLLYFRATANATETAATVKAGSSQSVTATGSQSVTVAGLTAGTAYYLHYVQADAAGNTSNVVSAAFTTPAADTTAPTWPNGAAITQGTITSTSVSGSYAAASDNVGVTGYQKRIDGGAWQENGTGLSFSFSGLAASTTYVTEIRAKDAAGNFSPALSLSMTTTAASAGGTISTDPISNAANVIAGNLTGLTVTVLDATTLAAVQTFTNASTGADGRCVVTGASLVVGTLYAVAIRDANGNLGIEKYTAA